MTLCRICKINEATVCEDCLTSTRTKREHIFDHKVWQKAGKKCEMCGELDKKCLTVHHLDKLNHPYDPEFAKLLCFNCHFGRTHNIKRNDKPNEEAPKENNN
jgi:hypothetical protein